MIIVLDGPINAGKSTVGAKLARRMPHTVHIEGDHLRHFAPGLTLEQAIPYTLEDAADLAAAWIKRGFHVIVNWPIERANLHPFAALSAETGSPLFVFTLLPRLGVALRDRGQRPLSSAERQRIQQMYDGMYSPGRAAGMVIDNSDQSPDETAAAILGHIQAAVSQPESDAGSQPGPTLTLTDQPAPADTAYIRQRIKEFNDSVSEFHRLVRPTGKEPLAAFMHDQRRRLIGGLVASVYWGWLDIDELWIAEDWRGQGYGRQLMDMVEAAAVKRDCRWAQVKTWDFQAIGFYEKAGYEVVGQLVDYPPDHTFFWLRKALNDGRP
jgi:ribosomal protein S18 acetylase RimI-like enzyme